MGMTEEKLIKGSDANEASPFPAEIAEISGVMRSQRDRCPLQRSLLTGGKSDSGHETR